MRYASLLLCLLFAVPAWAQWSDTFADGDFTAAPTWFGDTAHWRVVADGADFALNTNGPTSADTLVLATSSDIAFGTWRFRFAHRDVNLSTANGARIFLTSTDADLDAGTFGYYLQFGTNNSDRIELYRVDGSLEASDRVRIGQSDGGLLAGTDNDLHVEVRRTNGGAWHVFADGAELFTAADDRYAAAGWFGLWVKHSSANGTAFLFDDFEVFGIPDTDPPRITLLEYSPTRAAIDLSFDEGVTRSSASRAFSLSGPNGMPVAIADTSYLVPVGGGIANVVGVSLGLHRPLSGGTHRLRATGLTDAAGNVSGTQIIEFDAEADPPPRLVSVRVRSSTEIDVAFNKAVDGCVAEAFLLAPGDMPPECVVPCPQSSRSYTLRFASPLVEGVAYTLHVGPLADNSGTDMDAVSVPFFFGEPPTPEVGDVVVNEFLYDPPSSIGSEYVELLNLSDRPFDLARFTLSDDRDRPVPLLDTTRVLAPGAFAVIAQDSAAFAAAFPDVPFLRVPDWPTLNNSRDAVVLGYSETVLERIDYTADWGGEDVALERIDPGLSASRRNFLPSTASDGGTPGGRNSVYAPDETPPHVTFAEQRTDTTVDVYLTEPVDTLATRPAAFEVGGTAAVQFTPVGMRLVLTFDAPISGRELAVGVLRDEKGNPSTPTTIPLAQPPAPSSVVLNEIMFDAGEGAEYVEVRNVSGHLLNLAALRFADERDTVAVSTAPLGLPDGAYVALTADSAALLGRFPDAAFAHVPSFPGLANDGEPLLLLNREATVLDSVRYTPAWHHPDALDTRQLALERRAPTLPSNASGTWGSSTHPAGGTPGQINSLDAQAAPVTDRPGLTATPRTISPDRDGIDDATTLTYTLRRPAATVRLRVFDAAGRLVRTLSEASLSGQAGALVWDGFGEGDRTLRLGIYIVVLDAVDAEGGAAETHRTTVVLARKL